MTDEADQLYERLLILRCQAGDDAAFAELLQRYNGRLRYYVQKMIADREAAEDVLQEIWFGVFRGLRRLDDPAAFPAWLYRIARNRAYVELRKRQPLRKRFQDIASADLPDPAEEFGSDDIEGIHRGLDQLPAEQREVLMLRFLEGMSYEEIGAVTGLPLGTVRSRIFYGKRALRQALERMNLDG
jgi:RNA polymerase sigma-70 factor, ECF subfamily